MRHAVAAIVASALLAWLYALGGAACALGFVMLAPWLRSLDASPSMRGTLLNAWAMSVAFTLAVFGWFASAIGEFTQWGTAVSLAVLLVAAPLFQPQFLAFALARRIAGRRHGVVLRALAAAAAWVAVEWAFPKVLGDTLGHGLHASRVLRQAADVGGAAGLTLMLLLANEAIACALARHARGARALAAPVIAAAAVPLLLAAYGLAVLASPSPTTGTPLRVGLVQSNIADYERLRAEKGAAAVVREVLDTHFAMSYDAVVRQHADAVLWSETVYPTTFGHAKSEAGAALDREIQSIVNAAGVPFVFGTYDVDAAGEYNAAAFVEPNRGLLGFYRKTRLFPFTEHVPAWLDGEAFRRAFPWTGTWQAGSGARVFPLRLADGREIPVLPLICRDDVDPSLAIDGARLGAQALLTMSNDAWFTAHPQGAALHQAVATFRSIETRLPQLRVTTNGFSAVIDASGDVIAGTRMGERTLVIGDVKAHAAPRTLMLQWGDWVGRAGAAFLALLAALAALQRWAPSAAEALAPTPDLTTSALAVSVLPIAARVAAGALRAFARASLLGMIAAVALGDARLQTNTLAQIRVFATLFLAPEAAAWCVMRAFAARASVADGALSLVSGARRLALPLSEIAAIEPWRVPIPGPGVSIRLATGESWRHGLACAQPLAFQRALAAAGVTPARAPAPSRAGAWAQASAMRRRTRLDQPLVKFVLFPLLLAIPAFRLHQHIAYGDAFGEFYTFGLKAYMTTFALWWAAWIIGVVLCAAALRAVVEAGTLAGIAVAPSRAGDTRLALQRLGFVALYLGLPTWLLVRMSGL